MPKVTYSQNTGNTNIVGIPKGYQSVLQQNYPNVMITRNIARIPGDHVQEIIKLIPGSHTGTSRTKKPKKEYKKVSKASRTTPEISDYMKRVQRGEKVGPKPPGLQQAQTEGKLRTVNLKTLTEFVRNRSDTLNFGNTSIPIRARIKRNAAVYIRNNTLNRDDAEKLTLAALNVAADRLQKSMNRSAGQSRRGPNSRMANRKYVYISREDAIEAMRMNPELEKYTTTPKTPTYKSEITFT